MRVVIAGAGSVGRSIARELLSHDHEVMLVDKQPAAMRVAQVAEADWLLADACELSSLAEAKVDECDVIVAATGDDKVNLVVSLLAKTEFGVPRTVARVNNPKNEWMFDESWGVDVAVSTPRIMTAMVEEAVAVGDLVRIFTFHQSGADILEVTLPPSSPLLGHRVGEVRWPADTVLAAIVRGTRPIAPSAETLEVGDELLLVTGTRRTRARWPGCSPGRPRTARRRRTRPSSLPSSAATCSDGAPVRAPRLCRGPRTGGRRAAHQDPREPQHEGPQRDPHDEARGAEPADVTVEVQRHLDREARPEEPDPQPRRGGVAAHERAVRPPRPRPARERAGLSRAPAARSAGCSAGASALARESPSAAAAPPDAVPTPKPLRKPSTTSPTSGQRTTTDTRSDDEVRGVGPQAPREVVLRLPERHAHRTPMPTPRRPPNACVTGVRWTRRAATATRAAATDVTSAQRRFVVAT